METRVVRSSFKTIRLWYIFAVLVFLAGVFLYFRYWQDKPRWVMAVPLVFFLVPLQKHIQRQLISLTLHDDRLTLERGLFSKSRRTMDLMKVQDVSVQQTFGQRLMRTGDLSFETASESGPVTIAGIDRPREIADLILAGSRRAVPPPPASPPETGV